MQDIFIEYMVKKRRSPTTALLKVLLVIGAIVISIAAMMFSGLLGPLSIISPLIAVGAIYGAYYLISGMNIEFEYSVTNGEIDIDKIVAQRKRRRLVSINMRSVEDFGRYKASEHESKQYADKIFACDAPDSEDVYFCLTHTTKGNTLVVFNANERMITGIKPFLPRPIMHRVFARHVES